MITFNFLVTSLIVVLIPGTGVVYTISTVRGLETLQLNRSRLRLTFRISRIIGSRFWVGKDPRLATSGR